VGAAKFVRGLALRIDQPRLDVIVNTGDDEEFYGLHVSPDVDTITYTLAGIVNRAQGWGLEGETFNTLSALSRFYGKPWFGLGDQDLATHLYRTDRMRQGARLSRITAEIAARLGVRAKVMPMSDDRVRTFVKVRGLAPMPFQEYFVKRRFRGAVERIELKGVAAAAPCPAAIRSIKRAAAVIIAPSNPFVSIGPILGIRELRQALGSVKDRVVAISPIIGGKTVKGPADRMMRGLGHQVSPLTVAGIYRDIAGTFVLDNIDAKFLEPVRKLGMNAIATDTIMATPQRAADLASVVLNSIAR
jgi:LPPG:FO 2-phospho-L-lactate transferase